MDLTKDVDIEAAIDALYGARLFELTVRGIPVDSPEANQRARAAFELIWKGMEP